MLVSWPNPEVGFSPSKLNVEESQLSFYPWVLGRETTQTYHMPNSVTIVGFQDVYVAMFYLDCTVIEY